MAYLVRSEGAALHASIGTMSGCFLNMILDPIFIMPWGLGMGAAGRRMRYFFIQLCCLSVFLRPPICETWKYVCLYQSAEIPDQKGDCHGSMRRWHTSLHPEFAQRNRDDNSQQFHLRVRRRRSSCYGNLLQNLHGANAGVHGILSGDHAVSQLQFCLRGSKTHEASILFAIKLVVPALVSLGHLALLISVQVN